MGNKSFNLASHWEELGARCHKICLKEIDFKDLMVITKGWNPSRKFRLLEKRETRIRDNQAIIQAIEEQLTQIGNTQIPPVSQGVGQSRSPVASHHSGTNKVVAKSHHPSQSQAEKVRTNDPEAVGLGERSAQEPEIVVHTSRITNPTNRNITPTQTEHNVVTPESNLKSDKLWLQMSQFAVQNQESLADFESSEETNRRLNQIFEEQHHCKRDRDCLDQDIKKLFNVYQNMKPQADGHALENPYHQEDIKPDSLFLNKERSPSPYQDVDNMSYFKKEALKKLPDASSCPKFSGIGEYVHMELIDYIYGLFIDVPRIPDYWITDILNTEFK
ncbi:hypothetical protein O181_077382 [Austropuccinia psidii MF-1]|uniref:Uncharacterized protein n=1 Tax=Austropuccinia psidii MF-1 TaxID=1389203 RepID=A0A9Q3FFW1_9BASI|nr:hypothetical protein [Austropuccinia psidii MF-1]